MLGRPSLRYADLDGVSRLDTLRRTCGDAVEGDVAILRQALQAAPRQSRRGHFRLSGQPCVKAGGIRVRPYYKFVLVAAQILKIL